MTQASSGAGFWDDRYGGADYVYGLEPNDFLRENARLFRPGDAVLSLAEGEGRNGVFLAKQGCKVRGVDFSPAGRAKALQLAERFGVEIAYDVADLTAYDMGEAIWDGVVSIFCHLPEEHRPHVFRSVRRALKPGGLLLLESYNKKQLAYGTGGPNNAAYLPTLDELKGAFDGFEIIRADDAEREIQEGTFHSGKSAVTCLIARKPV